MQADQEKQRIIAAMIGLAHSLAAAPADSTAQAFAARVKAAISQLAAPDYQGAKLYAAIAPLRRDIAYAVSLDHWVMTPAQAVDWREFQVATQYAWEDFQRGLSVLRTLPG